MTQSFPLSWPEGWPRTPIMKRRSSAFQMSPDKSLQLLHNEIKLLPGSALVISSSAPCRNDGTPYREAMQQRLADPGVAIYFVRAKKQQVMARDAFLTVHDNLHSLALAIQAMRALERHGGNVMMDRAFDGFAALPPPAARATPWWQVLDLQPDAPEWMIEAAYRHHAKTKHPDAGGSESAMAELNRAREEGLKANG